MKRFIALLNFTDQGRKTIKDSPKRADEFIEQAEAAGAKINALYWTIGGCDGVLSYDAPDEESAAALMVGLAAKGNVTTQTLRAFHRNEIAAILDKVE